MQVAGFYVTSYIMGQVYSIILNLDTSNNHFISLMQNTNSWFKLRQFPVDMREQIKRYFELQNTNAKSSRIFSVENAEILENCL